jgi:hypothetical protein
MLILGKFKDYYDYLSGIYGIDKDIVYDRSDATVLGKEFSQHEEFFTKRVLHNDSQKKMKKRWITNENGKDVFANVPTGQISAYVIEIGYTHYLFEIERYLDESGNVKIDVEFVKSFDVEKKKSESPISLIPCQYTRYLFLYNERKVSGYNIKQEIKNPILKDTYITSFIDPTEIYDKVYNYLISIREKPIVDKRNDVQKLEGYGFDKKSSFRHPIK